MTAECAQDEDRIVAPSDQKTLEWIAVLSAARIDFRLSRTEGRWVIHVPLPQSGGAHAELSVYESENRNWPFRLPSRGLAWQPPQHTLAALWGLGLVVAFYVWFGPYDPENALLRAASADADAILAGQWWRALTALTVHAGFTHVAGNALGLLFLGHAVCRLFGGGLGWLLLLGSGVVGNLAVAFLVRSAHISVGASTACFGAIGILVTFQTLQMLRRWQDWRSIWSRVWMPLGSGIALLALLGTGPDSDVTAHLFGFVFGVVFSAPFCLWGLRWFPSWGQRALELVCVLAVLCAWASVFKHLG